MNIYADMWRYAELCTHDLRDSGDGDDDLTDFISDHIEVNTPGSLFSQTRNQISYMYSVDEPERIVISFRGTRGKPAWLNNFKMWPPVDGYMHRGFYDLMQAFAPAIEKLFVPTDRRMKSVYLTGHSLGGITAQYCAKYLYEEMRIVVTCVNFGAPVGGYDKWRQVMDSYPIDNTRVVNGWDAVTELGNDTIAAHAGKLLRLKQPFWRRLFRITQVQDHFYSRYTDALIRYSTKLHDAEAVEALKIVRKRCTI